MPKSNTLTNFLRVSAVCNTIIGGARLFCEAGRSSGMTSMYSQENTSDYWLSKREAQYSTQRESLYVGLNVVNVLRAAQREDDMDFRQWTCQTVFVGDLISLAIPLLALWRGWSRSDHGRNVMCIGLIWTAIEACFAGYFGFLKPEKLVKLD